jgi:hypothetical protein
MTISSALSLVSRRFLAPAGVVFFPLVLAFATWVFPAKAFSCERDITVDTNTDTYILGDCRGACSTGAACTPQNQAKQGNGDLWSYCCCWYTVGICTHRNCGLIYVQHPNGTVSVECFDDQCNTSCAQSWSAPDPYGISTVYCNCQ